ncbi:phage tail protein [Cupriavidus basilensis]
MTQQLLNDLNHWVGGDIGTSPTGDFGTATADLRTNQRIVRRLTTNPKDDGIDGGPPDYIFHPDYGGGLPRMIGKPLNIPATRSRIRAQLRLEEGVAQSPEPQITVNAITNGVSVGILYTSSITRRPVSLQFNVTK